MGVIVGANTTKSISVSAGSFFDAIIVLSSAIRYIESYLSQYNCL